MLREEDYFCALFQGDWKEAKEGFISVPEDGDIIEAILLHVYGAPLKQILKPIFLTVQSKSSPDQTKASIALDVDLVKRAQRFTGKLIDLVIASDKYLLPDLVAGICTELPKSPAFARSFKHPDILDLIQRVYEETGTRSDLRKIFGQAVAARADLLFPHTRFQAFLQENAEFMLDVMRSIIDSGTQFHEHHDPESVIGTGRFCDPCAMTIPPRSQRTSRWGDSEDFVIFFHDCNNGKQHGLGPERSKMWPFEATATSP